MKFDISSLFLYLYTVLNWTLKFRIPYMCMCICIYILYVCMYVCMYVCISLSVSLSIDPSIYLYIIYAQCMYVYLFVKQFTNKQRNCYNCNQQNQSLSPFIMYDFYMTTLDEAISSRSTRIQLGRDRQQILMSSPLITRERTQNILRFAQANK